MSPFRNIDDSTRILPVGLKTVFKKIKLLLNFISRKINVKFDFFQYFLSIIKFYSKYFLNQENYMYLI